MDAPPTAMRDLAHRLLAAEVANPAEPHPHVGEAVRVCERLRVSLTRFAGADGFAALMRRALAMARVHAPSLHEVEVKADGSLEGLKEITPEAATVLATQLLDLLVVFIGERLTLRLVGDAWPSVSFDIPEPESQ